VTIKPSRLKQGDGVGVIAPAGPITQSEIQPGISLLESSGFKVFVSSHLYDRQGYLAGDDHSRLSDLHAMFQEDRVRAIFCARGGYGTMRLFNRINFELIRRNPKIIMGYSDITALLLAIYEKADLMTFHGPVITDLSKDDHRNFESFLSLVSSDGMTTASLSGGRVIKPGKAKGILLGGNLSLICYLVGTPFMPSLKGAILFVEERGEPLYRLDRMLTYLRLCGVLEHCAGLIAGGFEECGDQPSVDQLLADRISDLDVPVLSGLPIGHGLENIALPIGAQAVLDTEKMTLSTTEPCVNP
jgi:muramoyltetrapeptide carboxypeptidase